VQGIKFKCEGSVHSKDTTKSKNKNTHTENSNNNLLPNYICDWVKDIVLQSQDTACVLNN